MFKTFIPVYNVYKLQINDADVTQKNIQFSLLDSGYMLYRGTHWIYGSARYIQQVSMKGIMLPYIFQSTEASRK